MVGILIKETKLFKVMNQKIRRTPEEGSERRNSTFLMTYPMKSAKPAMMNMATVVMCPDLVITPARIFCLSLSGYSISDRYLNRKFLQIFTVNHICLI